VRRKRKYGSDGRYREGWNLLLRSYDDSLGSYLSEATEVKKIIVAKREFLMNKVSRLSTEAGSIDFPWVSYNMTGNVEIDWSRYNFSYHRYGFIKNFDDVKLQKEDIFNIVQMMPVNIPYEVNFWDNSRFGVDSMLLNFLTYHSFNPIIPILDKEKKLLYNTFIRIDSISDQSQEDPTSLMFFNYTVALTIEARLYYPRTYDKIVKKIVNSFVEIDSSNKGIILERMEVQ